MGLNLGQTAATIRSLTQQAELQSSLGDGQRINYSLPGERRNQARILLTALGVENTENPTSEDRNLLDVIHTVVTEFFNSRGKRGEALSATTNKVTRVGDRFKPVRDALRPKLIEFFKAGDHIKRSSADGKDINFNLVGDIEGKIFYNQDGVATALDLWVRDTSKWGIDQSFKGSRINFKLDYSDNRELRQTLRKA